MNGKELYLFVPKLAQVLNFKIGLLNTKMLFICVQWIAKLDVFSYVSYTVIKR